MSRISLSLLVAAAALSAGAARASAAPTAETATVHVPVADLNLASEAGARVALRRIARAAEVVCGDEADTRDLQRRAMFETCVRGVVDRTVASAHSPMLAALNGAPAHERLAAAD